MGGAARHVDVMLPSADTNRSKPPAKAAQSRHFLALVAEGPACAV